MTNVALCLFIKWILLGIGNLNRPGQEVGYCYHDIGLEVSLPGLNCTAELQTPNFQLCHHEERLFSSLFSFKRGNWVSLMLVWVEIFSLSMFHSFLNTWKIVIAVFILCHIYRQGWKGRPPLLFMKKSFFGPFLKFCWWKTDESVIPFLPADIPVDLISVGLEKIPDRHFPWGKFLFFTTYPIKKSPFFDIVTGNHKLLCG